MLQNCYKLHTFVTIDGDVKSGHFSTKKCIVKSGRFPPFPTMHRMAKNPPLPTMFKMAKNPPENTLSDLVPKTPSRDPHGRAGTGARNSPWALYARGELEAGSWKLL